MKVITPKADPALAPALKAMIDRGEAFGAECKRRGVKFLPLQAMRPIYIKEGLSVGAMIKPRSEEFLVLKY